MVELRTIRLVAARGLRELGRACVTAPRNVMLRPLLRRAWGPLPVLSLGLLAIAAGVGGVVLGGVLPQFWFVTAAVWPVVLVSLVAASRIRGVLRQAPDEMLAAPDDAFRALALPLVPAAGVLVLVTTLAPFLLPASWPGAAATASPTAADALELAWALLLSWLAHGAGLAVCTAALVGRRERVGSLVEVGWRWFVFRLLLSISLFVVGLLSSILWETVAGLLLALTGWSLPARWLGLFDRGVDGGIAALVYLALIGGAWLAAEEAFPRLVRTGDVHFLGALAGLLGSDDDPPEDDPDPSWPRPAGVPPPVPSGEPAGR